METLIMFTVLLVEANIAASFFVCIGYLIWRIAKQCLIGNTGPISSMSLHLCYLLLLLIPAISILCVLWISVQKLFFSDISYWYECDAIWWFVAAVFLLFTVWLIRTAHLYRKMRVGDMLRRQIIRCGEPAPEEEFIREQAKRLNITEPFDVQRNAMVDSPMVVYSKGRIVIQYPMMDMPGEMLRVTCTHELQHIKHKDYRKNRLLRLAKIIWWYNPVVKFMADDLELWIELCRDHAAIRAMDYDAQDYYCCMADFLALRRGMKEVPDGVKFTGKNQMMIRMNLVKRFCEKNWTWKSRTAAVILAVMFGGCMVMNGVFSVMAADVGYMELFKATREDRIEIIADCDIVTNNGENELRIIRIEEFSGTITLNPECRVETEPIQMRAGDRFYLSGIMSSEEEVLRIGCYSEVNENCFYVSDFFQLECKVENDGEYILFIESLSKEEPLNIEILVKIVQGK